MYKLKVLALIFIISFSACNKKSETENFAKEVYAAVDAGNFTIITLLIDKEIRENSQSADLIKKFIKYHQSFENLEKRKFISKKIDEYDDGNITVLEFESRFKNSKVKEYLTVKARNDGYKIFSFDYDIM